MTLGFLRTGSLRILIALFALLLLAYGIFEGRRILEGPRLTLLSPKDGATIAAPLLHIEGQASNLAYLSINGEQSYADEQGHFDAITSPPVGYTVITVSGTDRFGAITTRTARITIVNYCPLHAEA